MAIVFIRSLLVLGGLCFHTVSFHYIKEVSNFRTRHARNSLYNRPNVMTEGEISADRLHFARKLYNVAVLHGTTAQLNVLQERIYISGLDRLTS